MEIIRTGKVLPGYYADVFSKQIVDSLEFNYLCIYTLPLRLIEAIRKFQPGLFSEAQLNKELEFATNSPDSVVFEKAVGKKSPFLLYQSSPFDKEVYVQFLGESSYQSVTDTIQGPLKKLNQFGSAYCGWLLQQTEYQQDLAKLRDELQRREFDSAHDCMQRANRGDLDSPEENAPIINGKADFCQKWRLQSLITSELPNPFMPHTSALNFYTTDPPEGTAVPFIPDIYPIEGQGFLVDQLNQNRRNSCPLHLRNWMDLTSKSSGNSRPFEASARQYRVQHYWRVLNTRFPKQMKRKQGEFSHIFADFLETSQDSIRRDFQAIKKNGNLLEVPIDNRF